MCVLVCTRTFHEIYQHHLSSSQNDEGSERRSADEADGRASVDKRTSASGVDIVLDPEPVTQAEVEERLVQCCTGALAGCTDVATEQVCARLLAFLLLNDEPHSGECQYGVLRGLLAVHQR